MIWCLACYVADFTHDDPKMEHFVCPVTKRTMTLALKREEGYDGKYIEMIPFQKQKAK